MSGRSSADGHCIVSPYIGYPRPCSGIGWPTGLLVHNKAVWTLNIRDGPVNPRLPKGLVCRGNAGCAI